MNRRSFLRHLFVSPFVAQAVVRAAMTAAVTTSTTYIDCYSADALNEATLRFIKNNPRAIDAVFRMDPLLLYFRERELPHPFSAGEIITETFLYDA